MRSSRRPIAIIEPLPSASPNLARGAALYAAKVRAVPPGERQRASREPFRRCGAAASFNDGAGMAHIDRMTGFVRYNMPHNAPGSLSLEQAYDVAAFVLHHPRPHFRKTRVEQTPALPAKYF